MSIFTFFTILSVVSSTLNFSRAQISDRPLPKGLFGSNDFAFDDPINNRLASTITTEMSPTTKVLPSIQQCINNCLASAKITDNRPMCGSDYVTYDNHQHFDCARTCGKSDIQKMYTDRCRPLNK